MADLVIPIPNFQPGPMGMQSAYNDAMGRANSGTNALLNPKDQRAHGRGGYQGWPVRQRDDRFQILAQMKSSNPSSLNMPAGTSQTGTGAGGGAAMADFQSLIELITSTVQPTTWDEVGGPGSIKEFATNLSLVVSQTQDVHEEIVELLEQLRRCRTSR